MTKLTHFTLKIKADLSKLSDTDIAWSLALFVILIKVAWLDSPLHWDEIDVYGMPVLNLYWKGLGLLDYPETFTFNPFGAQLITYFAVKILGFAPWVLKFHALISSAVSTSLLYLISRRFIPTYPAILTCLCFSLNPTQYYLSDRYLGEVLALPFLMAYVYCYFTKLPVATAIFGFSLGWLRQTTIAFSALNFGLRRPQGIKDWALLGLPFLSVLSFMGYLQFFSGNVFAHQTFAEGRFNWDNFLGHGMRNGSLLTFYAQGKWILTGLLAVGCLSFFARKRPDKSTVAFYLLGLGLVCLAFILFLAFDNGSILRYYQLILPFQILAVFLLFRTRFMSTIAACLILPVGFAYYYQVDDGYPQESLENYRTVTSLSSQMGWYLDQMNIEKPILTGWPFPNMFRVPEIGYVNKTHPIEGYDELHYFDLPEDGPQRDQYLRSIHFEYILAGSLTDQVIRDLADELLAEKKLKSIKRFESGDLYIELYQKINQP